jgi:Protein of unknown function (DUF3800)
VQYGFYLFIDEAGDEGLDRIRPRDPDGASEYFVLCGILIRTDRYKELLSFVSGLKQRLALSPHTVLHFSDLSKEQQDLVVQELKKFRMGVIAIVSNKRNMRRYRNERCEARHFEIVNGRKRPTKHNWFYNGLFRYMLERASAECARWTIQAYGESRKIKIMFAQRKGFSYSQTQAYLYKLKTSRHGPDYFNNRGKIDWSVVHELGVECLRPKNEPGLQLADCAASAIFRSVDENWFGSVRPSYLESLGEKFIKLGTTPRDYGFKLLPDGYNGPFSKDQIRGLKAVGYTFTSPVIRLTKP